MGIGFNIKKIMDVKNITVERVVELFEIYGVKSKRTGDYPKAQTIYAFLNERRPIEAKMLPYFAKALDVTELDFFDDSNAAKKEIVDRELTKNPKDSLSYLVKRKMITIEDIIDAMSNDGTKQDAVLAGIIGEKQLEYNAGIISAPYVYAGAGAEAFAIDKASKVALDRRLIPAGIDDKNLLIIKIVGDSMEPKYYENDIVFIDMVNGRNFMPINGTYLVRYGDTVQIKDVEFLGNGDILLSSRNSKAIIQPVKDLGLEWEIVGKPYVKMHYDVGSKLELS